jgi:hypothetical protein
MPRVGLDPMTPMFEGEKTVSGHCDRQSKAAALYSGGDGSNIGRNTGYPQSLKTNALIAPRLSHDRNSQLTSRPTVHVLTTSLQSPPLP